MPLRAQEIDDAVPAINGSIQAADANILSICAKLAERVNAFLETEAPTPLLKDVQNQTRVALDREHTSELQSPA